MPGSAAATSSSITRAADAPASVSSTRSPSAPSRGPTNRSGTEPRYVSACRSVRASRSASRSIARGTLHSKGMQAPEKLLLAAPRGYCAGVDRAVQTVERALDLYGAPVYVRKEIVHNKHVVEQLRERGAIFVDQE